MYNTYSPPLYRVKKRTKNGIFAYHYAKTPQKVGKKVIFFEVSATMNGNNHIFRN